MAFQEEFDALAPLQSFDPLAFQGDANASQTLCNFILALALIYNDCKDIVRALALLGEVKPAGPPPAPSEADAAWGGFSGIELHLLRVYIGVLHELFELIRSNKDILDDPFLIEVIRVLKSGARQNWKDLADIALGATPKTELGRVLFFVRNKVASHYDPKCLAIGYRKHFLATDCTHDRGYVSRGQSMFETRFYFADAAAQGYLYHLIGKEQFITFLHRSVDLLEQVNVSIMSVVDTFIQKRSAYRSAQ